MPAWPWREPCHSTTSAGDTRLWQSSHASRFAAGGVSAARGVRTTGYTAATIDSPAAMTTRSPFARSIIAFGS